LLAKRTYSVLVLLLLAVSPAVALAAADTEPGSHAVGQGIAPTELAIGPATPAALAPLVRPVRRFHRAIRTGVRRIRATRRARLRRERREAFATLPTGVSLATLEAIASCESGGNPAVVSADGSYRGKYQFSYGTWASVGGSGDPAAASEAEQDYRAALLYARAGSSPWPVCG
jgi:hypothetical protein